MSVNVTIISVSSAAAINQRTPILQRPVQQTAIAGSGYILTGETNGCLKCFLRPTIRRGGCVSLLVSATEALRLKEPMSKHIYCPAFVAIFFAAWAAPVISLAAASTDQSSVEVPVERTSLPRISTKSLTTDYAVERAYRPSSSKQPIIGLALSGGGTKAAMFSHGVLHGLHDAKVLERIDVISSVSGGSYAAFWYLSKYLESTRAPTFEVSQIFDDCLPSYWTKDDTDQDLKAAMQAAIERPPKPGMPECENAAHFRAKGTSGTDDPYRWQAHIVRWPDVLQVAPVYLNGARQRSPESEIKKGVARALSSEVLKNLFGGKSAVPRLYQYGIERTWGLNPLPRDSLLVSANAGREERLNWRYTHLIDSADSDMATIPRADPATLQWHQLRTLYDSKLTATPPPLWIANATDGDKKDGMVNTTKIFEITPFGYGSANPDHPGYSNSTPVPPIAIADLGTSVRASAGFADAQGLGNAKLQGLVSIIARFIPAVQWGVDITVPGPQKESIGVHLSDGGGSEDLGLYSLLKRGLNDIIVVDTAGDAEGNMSDICDVRRALKSENVILDFPALENLKGVCEGQLTKPRKLAYNVSAWKNPVVKGTATWPAIDGNPGRIARIWLIKAAWDERAVAAAYTSPERCGSAAGQVNCLLAVFYGHNRGVRSDSDNYMFFPQLSTVSTTANSSSYLFWGYRELGRMLSANLRVNDVGRLELRDDRQCNQVARKRKKGRRPQVMTYTDPTPC